MASVNPLDDEQQNKQPGAPVTTGGSGGASSGGGQGAGVAGAAPQSPVMQGQSSQQQNNGFTDVGTYLDANKAGSASLGNQVAGNLTSKFNDTKGGIDQSASAANSAVNSGYVPENTDLIKQVAANPTAAAKDPSKVSDFQSQLNDTYSGPTNWADLGTQQGKVNDAKQYAGLVNTPGGLNVYSQQAEGQTGGGQSQGINQLDTLLLGGSPSAMSTVKAAADPYSTLNDYINSQNTAIGNNVTAAQNTAQNASQDALNAFTGANGTLTDLNTNINNAASTALSTAQQKQAALQADIKALYNKPLDTKQGSVVAYGGGSTPWANTTNYNVGTLSPQDLQSLGLTQDQWNALRGQMQSLGTSTVEHGHNFDVGSGTTQLDLGKYLDAQDQTGQINANTVATPDQYAQMGAIEQLLGGKMPKGAAINPANAAQAGTAPAGFKNQFDYKTALAQSTAAEQQARQEAQQAATDIGNQADAQHNAEKQHTFGSNFLKDITTPAKYLANPLLSIPDEEKAVDLGNKAAKR